MHFENYGSTAIGIHENSDYRWLSLDGAIQSVFANAEPHRPVLPHLSAMLLALRYCPAPNKILELGLGGGAMQRFFQRYFPQTLITSIENNQRIIQLCKDWFEPDAPIKRIIEGDAQQKILEYHHQDIVIVDLFSRTGSPDFVSTPEFFKNCVNSLHDDGLLVINLITPLQMKIELTLELLRQQKLHFRTFSIPGFQNRVIIAAQKPLPMIDYSPELNNFANYYGLNLNNVVALS